MTAVPERFLPTVERAQVSLHGQPPDQTRRWAALVVLARIVRRETWREERALLPHEVMQMPRQPPAPVLHGGFSSWLVGVSQEGKARLEHVTDRVIDFRDVFLPGDLLGEREMFGIESAVEALVPPIPDDALECKDLRTLEASAYRGTRATREPPTFHGFDFRDTVEQGKRAVEELYTKGRGRILSSQVRAFAWPLLWLTWESPLTHAVVLADGEGELRTVTSAALAEREADRGE